MINLAGREDCDKYIKKEIKEAGLVPNKMPFTVKAEVKSKYYPIFHGWSFFRAWYYWVASTATTPLLFKYANKLYEKHGKVVRVDGHGEAPEPQKEFNNKWDIGVNMYHIDTQEGLNAFVKMVSAQTNQQELKNVKD